MNLPNDFVHRDFKLDAISYNKEQLLHYAENTLTKSSSKDTRELADFIVQWFNSDSFIRVFTSGTTGKPKEILLEKQSVIFSAQATGRFFKVENKSRALLCMSTNFIAGKLMLIRALILGWDLHVVVPCSNPLDIVEGDFDFVAMVPMQVQGSLEELSRVKCLIIGGAKLSETLRQALLPLSVKVYETYGMSETITHIAAKELNQEYFTTLSHVKIAQDHRGCLVIDVPSISAESIITNDVVDLLGEDKFLWKGRIDNVINSGGVKLFPEQIEQVLSPHIPYPFFIGAKKDSYLGNKVVLVIQAQAYTIEDSIFAALHKYQRPKEIQFCDLFITTESGKIIRDKNIK